MTDVLADILVDVRHAAEHDLRRRARRRQLTRRTAAGCALTLTLSTGVAAATGQLPSFEDLLGGGSPATVTDLGEDRQRVVLGMLEQAAGMPVSAVIADEGVSTRDRPAAAGTVLCDSTAGGLACAGTAGGTATGTAREAGAATTAPVTIPAGVRTYRVRLDGATGSAERPLYVPHRRLLLVVVGTVPVTGESSP